MRLLCSRALGIVLAMCCSVASRWRLFAHVRQTSYGLAHCVTKARRPKSTATRVPTRAPRILLRPGYAVHRRTVYYRECRPSEPAEVAAATVVVLINAIVMTAHAATAAARSAP